MTAGFDLILLVVVLSVGLITGYYFRKQKALSEINSAEAKADKIISDAKAKEKELSIKAQEKALAIIDEAKKEEGKRYREINELQKRLEKRETTFSQKLLELQDKQQKLYDKVTQIEEAKEKIKKIREEQLQKLEKIANLDKKTAQEILLKNVEEEVKDALISRIKKLEQTSSEELEEKTKAVMAITMQRLAPTYTAEVTTTTVDLPNDEMKGRIIGREGRNIKTIENLTGVEIIVDDTPNAITISGFSMIRRHIAKKALEKLILDGRIHPTKIEDAIEQAKKELSLDIKKSGEEALYDLGIAGFDPKLVQIIGRLKYRTSYGQNILNHSVQVAHIAALLAEELKADVTLAKKGALLHDIGKAVDHEVQGTHPEIGANIAKKFNLPQEIINPILTHHEDKPADLISVIVKVADAISSARPGARKDTLENYLKRLEELEKVAMSFAGVEKCYAIQAGREVRVFVEPETIDDLKAYQLAKDIAKQIEADLKYPGEIKVNVIREMRCVEYAR
ncbi:ribonuclease Y [Candidatus Falkowbacteria bacterium CG10_big_fil_rev_8_21_14_0_10_37_6]|uniref:Ribonuclease Y n=1 Tax=Candidatus Falkowbacteria bacterium CG10_big_fil_rev_8_21_14_0_10_37_6 TaxID=1974563 RepID=A0A2H0V758_9BACT|nr:MAG: ribonuclease Y [Candidatus Falkowbacteria bacterium CG10_big_fil_rev_8_21_14_0_10_37_6]